MTTHRITLAALTLALGACQTVADLPAERVGQAKLTFANGLPAGTAQLVANGDTVTLALAVTGIAQGEHGLHLHTTGKCEASGFTSAGGHLNPAGKTHGHLSPGGSHLGDLPNLTVGSNRTASVDLDLTGTRAEIEAQIFDADGTAIVIHADPDDYLSNPAGNAGSRIVCGVIKRPTDLEAF